MFLFNLFNSFRGRQQALGSLRRAIKKSCHPDVTSFHKSSVSQQVRRPNGGVRPLGSRVQGFLPFFHFLICSYYYYFLIFPFLIVFDSGKSKVTRVTVGRDTTNQSFRVCKVNLATRKVATKTRSCSSTTPEKKKNDKTQMITSGHTDASWLQRNLIHSLQDKNRSDRVSLHART